MNMRLRPKQICEVPGHPVFVLCITFLNPVMQKIKQLKKVICSHGIIKTDNLYAVGGVIEKNYS